MEGPIENARLQPVEEKEVEGVTFCKYTDPQEIIEFKQLNDSMLSESYTIYTYRYFVDRNPDMTYYARDEKGRMVGLCICKADNARYGYIGMVSVIPEFRGKGIAKALTIRCINAMIRLGFDVCGLETEVDNYGALRLYESLGFRKTRYLRQYYQNGNDAYRLQLDLLKM